MTAKKKNILIQSWKLYYAELKKELPDNTLDEVLMFDIFKDGFCLAMHTVDKLTARLYEDIGKSKLGENHDG